MATPTTVIYYQRLVRHLMRAGRMVPLDGDEALFQQAVEFELRRVGIPFASQVHIGSGRWDMVVGAFGIELKVERATVMPVVDAAQQVAHYLDEAPIGIDSFIVAILHLASRVVHIHHAARGEGTQLVLRKQGLLPMQSIGSQKSRLVRVVDQHATIPAPLTHKEYEALRDAMPSVRDQLICKLLRGTGLRISELLRCTARDLKFNGPEVALYITRSKKATVEKVYELIPIPPGAWTELRDWAKSLQSEQPIFKVSVRQVERVFAAAGLTSIGRRVHPHELRGVYITFLVDGGVPIEAVSHLVGHADYRTTQKAYYKLNAEKIGEIQRRIPV